MITQEPPTTENRKTLGSFGAIQMWRLRRKGQGSVAIYVTAAPANEHAACGRESEADSNIH
jgi:hypothetical protein